MIAARRGQRDEAGLIDRGHERRGAAVHDRHFGSVDFDDGVVDAEAGERRQHMLGGRAQRAVGVADHRGEFGRGHGADVGANLAIRSAVLTQANEDDAGIGFGRQHIQRGRRAGMDAYPANGGGGTKRGLPASFHSSRPTRNARAPLRIGLISPDFAN